MNILKLVKVEKTDQPVGLIRYLKYEASVTQDNQTQLGLKCQFLPYELQERVISSICVKDNVTPFGIDIVESLRHTLINEAKMEIQRAIINLFFTLGRDKWFPTMTWVDRVVNWILRRKPTLRLKKDEELKWGDKLAAQIIMHANRLKVKTRSHYKPFAIVNGKIASLLYDCPMMQIEPGGAFAMSAGELYEVGIIHGIKIYVDPHLWWKDDRILVGLTSDDTGGVHFVHKQDFDVPYPENFAIVPGSNGHQDKMIFVLNCVVLPVNCDYRYSVIPVTFEGPSLTTKIKDFFTPKSKIYDRFSL